MADVWWHFSAPCDAIRGRNLHAAVREPTMSDAVMRLRADDSFWTKPNVRCHGPFVEMSEVSRLRCHSHGFKAWLAEAAPNG